MWQWQKMIIQVKSEMMGMSLDLMVEIIIVYSNQASFVQEEHLQHLIYV